MLMRNNERMYSRHKMITGHAYVILVQVDTILHQADISQGNNTLESTTIRHTSNTKVSMSNPFLSHSFSLLGLTFQHKHVGFCSQD